MQAIGRIDITVPATQNRYEFYIKIVCEKLAELKKGTKVATYHSFGGDFPKTYELSSEEQIGTSSIELWIKVK
jgi:hypothetical protein